MGTRSLHAPAPRQAHRSPGRWRSPGKPWQRSAGQAPPQGEPPISPSSRSGFSAIPVRSAFPCAAPPPMSASKSAPPASPIFFRSPPPPHGAGPGRRPPPGGGRLPVIDPDDAALHDPEAAQVHHVTEQDTGPPPGRPRSDGDKRCPSLQLTDGDLLPHPPPVDDPHGVCHGLHLSEDVAGDHHGHLIFFSHPLQQIPHLLDARRVQAVGGLVQNQQLRPAQQGRAIPSLCFIPRE